MSNKTSKRARNGKVRSPKRRKAIVITGIIMTLLVASVALGQWEGVFATKQKRNKSQQATVTTQSLNDPSSPSKEYIYAGGRLIATEEPPGGQSCSYTLVPPSVSLPAEAASSSFSVSTQSGCAWTATTTDSFITITSGSGTGTGMVSFSVTQNTGASRNGTISIAGQTFPVTQAGSGCSYTLLPPSVILPAAATSSSFSVNTQSGCAWTATTTDSFITITAGSGTGIGTVSFSVTQNTGGSSRSGTISVAGLAFTVTQEGTTTNPVPSILNIYPPSVIAGSSSFYVTVYGSNFIDGSVVRVNSGARFTTFVSTGQLSALILSTDVASPGSLAITVFNPAPGGGTSNAATLTVNAPPQLGINVALAVNGGVATASSTYKAGYSASGTNNGDRKGLNWGSGGGWQDGTSGAYPDWLQVAFNGSKTIAEIDVFTLQDQYTSPSEPTPTMAFSQYGIRDFDVQYWSGSGWVNVPGGKVNSNSNVWRKFTFASITTDKIRISVTYGLANSSRIVEVEAYAAAPTNQPPSVNLSAPADGQGFATHANITVSANASDTDGSIVQVEFFANSTFIGSSTSGPSYSITWNDVAANSYTLTARATDNLGASTTSAGRTITVSDPVGPPPAPTNLTATAGDHSVSLAWPASSGATSYKVKRSTTSGGGYAVIAPSVPSTSYPDTGLTNGTRYYYVVTAVNSVGESGNSNEASAVPNPAGTEIIFDGSCGTAQPDDTSIPCNPNQEVPGTVFFQNFWIDFAAGDAVSVRLFNIDDYEYVFVNGTSRAFGNYGVDQTFDLTNFMVVGANNIQLYAVNLGYTPWCYGFTLTKVTGGGSFPSAPSSLIAAAISSSQINLSWTDNSTNEQGFKIERKTGAGSFSQIATVGANVTSYPDGGLTSSTSYTYRVRAYNGSGDSNYSSEASATTNSSGSPPAAPSSLAAAAVSSTQINLTWTDNSSNEDGFRLERKLGAGGTYALVATPGQNAISYPDTGLSASTTYYYRIKAFNGAGESDFSSETSAMTSAGGSGGTCTTVNFLSGALQTGYVEGVGSIARWNEPYSGSVAKDPVSNYLALFIADTWNARIRMLYLDGPNAGTSILIAGNGQIGYYEGGGDPFQAIYSFPTGVTAITDGAGVATELLVVDNGNCMIRKLLRPLSGSTWRPVWFSGQTTPGFINGSAADSQYYYPRAAILGNDGYVYVTDSGNGAVRKLDSTGASTTLVTGFTAVAGISVSRTSGTLYCTDTSTHDIWQVTTAGVRTRIAGNGTYGFADGTGTAAKFYTPYHLGWATTADGEMLYIGDSNNHRIRKLTLSTNEVTTFAGSGIADYQDGNCSTARFYRPRGVAIGSASQLYIIDSYNNRIRMAQ